MRAKILVAGVMALLAALVIAPAALGVADGYGGNLSTTPTSGAVGTTVTTTGEGLPGETFAFVFCSQSIPVGNAVASGTGAFTLVWQVPQNADTGTCTLRSTGSMGTVITETFTVTGGTTLAFTGAQIMFWIMAGLGLAALGAGFFMRKQPVKA